MPELVCPLFARRFAWAHVGRRAAADLQNADLQNANLRDANLEGANLRDADLWAADLGALMLTPEAVPRGSTVSA